MEFRCDLDALYSGQSGRAKSPVLETKYVGGITPLWHLFNRTFDALRVLQITHTSRYALLCFLRTCPSPRPRGAVRVGRGRRGGSFGTLFAKWQNGFMVSHRPNFLYGALVALGRCVRVHRSWNGGLVLAESDWLRSGGGLHGWGGAFEPSLRE